MVGVTAEFSRRDVSFREFQLQPRFGACFDFMRVAKSSCKIRVSVGCP